GNRSPRAAEVTSGLGPGGHRTAGAGSGRRARRAAAAVHAVAGRGRGAAGQREPHTMSLATADADGLPDVRIVMLHGADADGWAFATHAHSRKGGHLAVRPYAALAFHWPALGRQVRLRGPVATAPAEEAQADLHARSTGALAAALTGRQSDLLGSVEELARASDEAWERARREPDAPAPSWTLYRLRPDEVEFFQGDARRRHVRLRYRRTGEGWARELLWP
ncbi:LOW QUALITY PROTEIN: pyridoxamine 5'-phosphate oxidase, partial [Streptomyces viridosporus ATCC 14672]